MKYILFFLVTLFSLSLTAQDAEVVLSYEIEQSTTNKSQMLIYLHSLSHKDQSIKAINFSVVLPTTCVKVIGQQSIFTEAWTDHLQEVQIINNLDLTYGDWHYSSRWQYGSADPGLPGTTAIIAPAQDKPSILMMTLDLEGTCTDKIYLEQQYENPVNQIGDANVKPLAWTVIAPKTKLELEGLELDFYPNPTRDHLYVNVKGKRDHPLTFFLTNTEGRQLNHVVLKKNQESSFSLNLSKFSASMYLLQEVV